MGIKNRGQNFRDHKIARFTRGGTLKSSRKDSLDDDTPITLRNSTLMLIQFLDL